MWYSEKEKISSELLMKKKLQSENQVHIFADCSAHFTS